MLSFYLLISTPNILILTSHRVRGSLSHSHSYSLTSHTRGSASAAEPPGCSSHSLSLLDTAAAAATALLLLLLLLLLLAPERLRFGTRPDELAPPARARFFWFFFFLGGLWEGLVLKSAAGKPSSTRIRSVQRDRAARRRS